MALGFLGSVQVYFLPDFYALLDVLVVEGLLVRGLLDLVLDIGLDGDVLAEISLGLDLLNLGILALFNPSSCHWLLIDLPVGTMSSVVHTRVVVG